MMSTTMRFLSFGAGTFVAIACCACGPKEAPKTAAPPATAPAEARDVRVAVAAESGWPHALRATGETVAQEDATLASKVAGRIEELAVDLGTRVKKGDAIARLEARELELEVDQADSALVAARALLGLVGDADETQYDVATSPAVRAAQTELDDAQREKKRLADLVGGVISQSALDTATARVATAEADLEDARQTTENRRAIVRQRRADLALARQKLVDAVVLAPFDGAVAARLVSVGDYVSIGAPIARLVRFDPLRVRVQVPERDAALVRTGQTATVEIAGAKPIEARVARTAPSLSDASRTLYVELDLPNADLALRPGSFAATEIVVDAARSALSVPPAAVVSFAGVDMVFLVEDGVANERRITVGRRTPERVEVLGGLKAGAQVVLSPGNLRGGTAVRATR